MSNNHRITVIGEPRRCQARCTCLGRSPVGDRGAIEQWIFLHHQQVERTRARLENRNPSLKKTLAWFRAQEADTENPAEDRVLWKRLADEIEAFAQAKDGPAGEQLALW